MNTTLIISCIASLALGGLVFWFLTRNSLIKDIASKKEESDRMLTIAKNKVSRISKEGEKKARQFKESQIKRVKQEVEQIKKDSSDREQDLIERESNIKKIQTELTKSEARLEVKEKTCEEVEQKYRTKEQELNEILEDAKLKIETIAMLTREEAVDQLVSTVEEDAKIIAARRIKEIENNLNQDAERKSKNIIALAIQKFAAS